METTLGFRDLGFRVWVSRGLGVGFGVEGLEVRVYCLRLRV